MKEAKKILIATPCYDGKVDAVYVTSLHETIISGINNDISFFPMFICYDALIQNARNDLIKYVIDFDLDGIIWIDSDTEWNADWAIEAIKSNKDAYGIPVIKKSITGESYNVKCKPENLIENGEGLIEVESIGTGWLYLSKKAVDYLWENSEQCTNNNSTKRWVFEVKIENGEVISEDVLMCNKLREGGFKVYINPNHTCNHVGVLKYRGDFSSFIKRIKS